MIESNFERITNSSESKPKAFKQHKTRKRSVKLVNSISNW